MEVGEGFGFSFGDYGGGGGCIADLVCEAFVDEGVGDDVQEEGADGGCGCVGAGEAIGEYLLVNAW